MIKGANKFIGQTKKIDTVKNGERLHHNYVTSKKIINEIIHTGRVNIMNYPQIDSKYENSILEALPPVKRSGMFYQRWVII